MLRPQALIPVRWQTLPHCPPTALRPRAPPPPPAGLFGAPDAAAGRRAVSSPLRPPAPSATARTVSGLTSGVPAWRRRRGREGGALAGGAPRPDARRGRRAGAHTAGSAAVGGRTRRKKPRAAQTMDRGGGPNWKRPSPAFSGRSAARQWQGRGRGRQCVLDPDRRRAVTPGQHQGRGGRGNHADRAWHEGFW